MNRWAISSRPLNADQAETLFVQSLGHLAPGDTLCRNPRCFRSPHGPLFGRQRQWKKSIAKTNRRG
jgi:hypothetical protein